MPGYLRNMNVVTNSVHHISSSNSIKKGIYQCISFESVDD
jgi:hypothetical protein